MVTIGSLTWTAKVENAGRAQSKANDVADSMEEADEKANGLNTSLGETGSKLKGGAKKSKRMSTRMTSLTGVLGLVTSALFFLGGTFASVITYFSSASTVTGALVGGLKVLAGWITGLWATIGGFSGIVATLTGWFWSAVGAVQGFIAWLGAGSAGALAMAAAIGAAIGMFVVWILHITGVMDWVGRLGAMVGTQLPGWVADGLLVIIGIFAGWLAVLGGFINGFIEGTMKGGFVNGIKEGLARAGEVLDVFAGAFDRTLGRITGFATDAWDNIKSSAVDTLGDIGDVVGNNVRAGFNAVVPSSVSIPSVTLSAPDWAGGMSKTIGGGSINLPQLASGGMIEEDGLFMGHAGERVLNPAETKKTNEAGGPSPLSGGGGGVTIQTLNVEIGDQTLDLSNLSTMELEELAEAIARETGLEVESIIGGGL